METTNCLTSSCRYCHYYQPEGRRGGMCQQLGVPVQGKWKACCLALPTFTPAWATVGDIVNLPEAQPVLASSHPLTTDPQYAEIVAVKQSVA